MCAGSLMVEYLVANVEEPRFSLHYLFFNGRVRVEANTR